MKAAQWNPKQKKVVVNDVPIPEPGKNQSLIKIKSASLCHSDVMATEAPRDVPVTLGHEAVGYIDQVHPSIEGKGFGRSDRVGFLYIDGCCFECDGCQIHNLHCQPGKQLLHGFTTDGFFAEYATVDYQNVGAPEPYIEYRVNPDTIIQAFHAVNSWDLKSGNWLGVIRCGGLGQLATQYGKAMGLRVIGIDINDNTLEVCKQQGAEAVFNSRSDKNYIEDLQKLTGGGCHAVAVFSNADAAYASAPSTIRLGGTSMVIGLPHKPLQISSMDLTLGRYRIKSESTSIPQRMGKAVEFTAKHGIQPEVEFRKLQDVNEMLSDMRSGKATKRLAVVF
ncbi:alcohol dehydrogenase [Cryomyces antarcticus]